MIQKNNNWPQISGNVKFSPYPGTDLTAGVADFSQLSPASVIVIGLLLVALGFYLYHQQKDKKEN